MSRKEVRNTARKRYKTTSIEMWRLSSVEDTIFNIRKYRPAINGIKWEKIKINVVTIWHTFTFLKTFCLKYMQFHHRDSHTHHKKRKKNTKKKNIKNREQLLNVVSIYYFVIYIRKAVIDLKKSSLF